MHEQGASAWFSDGEEERTEIYIAGRPWKGKKVLEIGCGEGHLASMIAAAGANYVTGIDYANEAIALAKEAYHLDNLTFWAESYRELGSKKYAFDILVMQGVLEHLDDPWVELKWMLDTFQPKEMVISAPCFLNPRGYVWMVLATMFSAPMSLTDLHFLHPWDFKEFADSVGMQLRIATCDRSWGGGPDMIADYKDRLPKVMRDLQEKLDFSLPYRTSDLFHFLQQSTEFLEWEKGVGATAIYHFLPKTV